MDTDTITESLRFGSIRDLDHFERTNKWEILILDPEDRPTALTGPLQVAQGTVVLWQVLDRVLTYKDPDGHWARRKLLDQQRRCALSRSTATNAYEVGLAREHAIRSV